MHTRTLSFVLLFSAAACGASQEPAEPTAPVKPAEAESEPAAEVVPEGYAAVTSVLAVNDVDEAVAFYEEAFGAESRNVLPGPDGAAMHAELLLGDSVVMLGTPHEGLESPQELDGPPGSLHYYVPDVDAAFERAVEAGAEPMVPVTDQFWGDRWGMVTDPFGHRWGLGTAKVTLSPEQMAEGAKVAFSPDREKAKETIERLWADGEEVEGYKQPGYLDVTASLHLARPEKTLAFYQEVFGAEVEEKQEMPDGKLMHAGLQVRDSKLMVSEEMPEHGTSAPTTLGGTSLALYVYTADVDAVTEKAEAAGAEVLSEPRDMFWGDRVATVRDPSGHLWTLATHQRDVSPEEMKKAVEQMAAE